ncbi:MAG: hypothetical protein ACM3ZR_14135, partial [Pseudomonadota bacterium]
YVLGIMLINNLFDMTWSVVLIDSGCYDTRLEFVSSVRAASKLASLKQLMPLFRTFANKL